MFFTFDNCCNLKQHDPFQVDIMVQLVGGDKIWPGDICTERDI